MSTVYIPENLRLVTRPAISIESNINFLQRGYKSIVDIQIQIKLWMLHYYSVLVCMLKVVWISITINGNRKLIVSIQLIE